MATPNLVVTKDARPLAVNTAKASEITGIAAKTLRNWRTLGIGPAHIKVNGKTVLYLVEVLEAWLNDQPKVGA
ncbi:helix-turn-helix domain-containing protein [Corynebacterium belfantii]|uniref:helix-turn-helix transcriptional regulator n=1 Tax=Corynebacterium belfantii TaxID=2014537 RepID=UPI0035A86B71